MTERVEHRTQAGRIYQPEDLPDYWRSRAIQQQKRNAELRVQVRNLRRWNMGLLGCLALSAALLIAAGLLL